MKILFEDRAVELQHNKTKYLCIADLHLGFELDYLRKGARHIEKQSFEIVDNLYLLLEKQHADVLLLLGDIKHTITRTTNYEKKVLQYLFEKIITESGLSVILLKGNHDGALIISEKYLMNIKILSELQLGDVFLFHGHKKPRTIGSSAPYWIAGHIHPSVLLKDKFNNFLKKHVFLELSLLESNTQSLNTVNILENYLINKKILVLPSFNKYLAGYALNILRNNTLNNTKKELGYIGTLIKKNSHITKVYLLDGTYLTTLDKLSLNAL